MDGWSQLSKFPSAKATNWGREGNAAATEKDKNQIISGGHLHYTANDYCYYYYYARLSQVLIPAINPFHYDPNSGATGQNIQKKNITILIRIGMERN